MNKQKIIIKYACLAAKQLYEIEDLKIEFPYVLSHGFSVLNGRCTYQDNKIIRFNGKFYNELQIDANIWYVIVHEVTHLKLLGHTKDFWLELKDNLEKTEKLRKSFYKEVGGDSDLLYDYEVYFDNDLTDVDEEDIDYECLDDEDLFFETYGVGKE